MEETVYENSGDNRSAGLKGGENFYEEMYMNEDLRSNKGTKAPEPSSAAPRWYRLAVVCLMLLVVLLLAAIAILWVNFNNLTIERDQLQTSYNNLTIERDQLQTSYNNLTIERDQLQTSYNNLTIERDQLQTSSNNLTIERDQLQTSSNNLTIERDQLQRKSDELQRKFSQLKEDINTPGWKYFSSRIYYISTECKRYSESREDCRRRGADLVTIKSREEQDFVNVWRRGASTWIGLNDQEKEGDWKWVDGTELTKNFWIRGEPNNIGDEDCAVSGFAPNSGDWVDISCNTQHVWICEKKIYS